MNNNKNLRMTVQRRVILDALKHSSAHPTADEVFDKVRGELPHISLGTVYRNLEVMTELGLIARVEAAGNQRRYDGRTESHSHIRCVSCGRVDDVTARAELAPGGDVGAESGYRVDGWRLEFTGTCPGCRVSGE